MNRWCVSLLAMTLFFLGGCLKSGDYLGGFVKVENFNNSAAHKTKKTDLNHLRKETFLYHYFSHARRSDNVIKQVARSYYSAYRSEGNEFKKKRIFESIKPDIIKRLDEAESMDVVYVEHTTRLSTYDFDRKAFSFQIPGAVNFHPYIIRFGQKKTAGQLPMDEQQAEQLISQNGRHVKLIISVKIDPKSKSGGDSMAMSGTIVNVAVERINS